MNVQVGPWNPVIEDGKRVGWTLPEGAVAAIDVRAISDQSTTDDRPGNRGIFLFDDDRDASDGFSRIEKSSLRAATSGKTAADIIFETMSKPIANEVPPIKPNRSGRLSVHLGRLRQSVKFNADRDSVVSASLRGDHQKIRQLHGSIVARRWLGYQVRKLKLKGEDWKKITSRESERPLDPSTTVTEDFTRADGFPIGNQNSWTQSGGDGLSWRTTSNDATHQNSTSRIFASCDSLLSSEDQLVSGTALVFSTWPNYACGVATRVTAIQGAQDGYLYWGGNGGSWLSKYVSNVVTYLATYGNSFATDDTISLLSEGSDHTPTRAGVSEATVTDSSLTGILRFGIGGYRLGPGIKDIEATDELGVVHPITSFIGIGIGVYD